jgi:heme-degrading monooxygenase HmoA
MALADSAAKDSGECCLAALHAIGSVVTTAKEGPMWARVSTYQLPADDVDAAIERFNQALGDVNEPGLERGELLVDRSSGKALTITVWTSEETLQASVEAANQIRDSAAEEASVSILDVSHFEILEPIGGQAT